MDKKIGWKFPRNDGGTEAGLNDSGIETYAGKPLEHLAREIIQNSLDAKEASNKPVIVAFQMKNIRASDFPECTDILEVMKQCLRENRDGGKAKEFFQNAIDILQKPEIPCLKVSDYNTTGLRDGDDYRAGQWHRLVKTTGRSDHGNEIAGGSFGIGKNAPFAVSSLRMVFYSTRYSEEDGTPVHKAQGKAILVSHQLKKNSYSQAIGFYGVKNNCAKITGKRIPKLLQRDEENGTTLLIPGFNETENWQNRIIAVVISNYFYAIHREFLRVEIKGPEGSKDIVIDAQSLSKVFDKTRGEDVATAHAYYRAISKNEPKTGNLKKLGKCFLWIMLEKDCDQSVAILRRGMKITNNQGGLIRWVLYEDFVAVCICASDEGNQILRAMENPAHDAFEPARLGAKSAYGVSALKELTKWIREEIRNVAQNEAEEVVQVPEMGEFLEMEDDDFDGEGAERSFDGGSHVLKKPTKIKPIIDKLELPEDIDDEDPLGTGGTGGTGGLGGTGGMGGPGGSPDPPGGPEPLGDPPPSPPVRAMKIGGTRVVSLTEKNGTEKRIMFTPQETGEGELSLKIAGDSFVEGIDISTVIGGDNATVHNGKVLLSVKKKTRVYLTVRLDQPTDAALLVILGSQTKVSS